MGVMEKTSPTLKRPVPNDEFMASMCAVTSLVLATYENFLIIGLTDTLPMVELSLMYSDQLSAVDGLHEVDSWHTFRLVSNSNDKHVRSALQSARHDDSFFACTQGSVVPLQISFLPAHLKSVILTSPLFSVPLSSFDLRIVLGTKASSSSRFEASSTRNDVPGAVTNSGGSFWAVTMMKTVALSLRAQDEDGEVALPDPNAARQLSVAVMSRLNPTSPACSAAAPMCLVPFGSWLTSSTAVLAVFLLILQRC
jgi:hypothetical protein